MSDGREALLAAIDRDREKIVGFFQDFIRAKSPNPPGDTREATGFIARFLTNENVPFRYVAPMAEMPNIVGSFDGGAPGRRLVLNGHIDVFPAGDGTGWRTDPWSGDLIDGAIYGRGAADMKAGTVASIFTYCYLHGIRDRLKGQLTLTAVSDEQTAGPWGSRYLVEHVPEVLGDCLLNGEPSGTHSIRFGEKGVLWLALTVRTPGSHGAYTHMSASATKIAARIITALEAIDEFPVDMPPKLSRALSDAAPVIDQMMGPGASEIVRRVTTNVGILQGGLKVNMVPGECRMEVDIRLPPGLAKEPVMREVDRILAAFPGVTVEQMNYFPPTWCDPEGEMIEILQRNVQAIAGYRPTPIVSIGGTDARLWRNKNVPGYVYGPPPTGMASADERVRVDDFLHVVRTHVLSAYDYLTRA